VLREEKMARQKGKRKKGVGCDFSPGQRYLYIAIDK